MIEELVKYSPTFSPETIEFVCWWIDFFRNIIYAYICVRVLKFLFIIFKSFLVHFVTPKYSLERYIQEWTVVTGGTDGIGRAYIEELAKERGIRKFYLIGRNIDKLNTTKQELEERYGCEVKIHVHDFEKDDLETLPKELTEMDVGILINCAGIAPNVIGPMTELPKGMASKILRVNLMSAVKMTELVMPNMKHFDKGIIVNISSMTGWRPLPYLSSYPASKAGLSFFSDALADENRGTNVHVQCLIPMLVATKVASYETAEANNIFVVTPENFAKQAVRIIGSPWEITTGCIQHDIQVAFGTLFSFWLFKVLFVPFVMLAVHKKRVAAYQAKMWAEFNAKYDNRGRRIKKSKKKVKQVVSQVSSEPSVEDKINQMLGLKVKKVRRVAKKVDQPVDQVVDQKPEQVVDQKVE